jgi:hypothetical protein
MTGVTAEIDQEVIVSCVPGLKRPANAGPPAPRASGSTS